MSNEQNVPCGHRLEITDNSPWCVLHFNPVFAADRSMKRRVFERLTWAQRPSKHRSCSVLGDSGAPARSDTIGWAATPGRRRSGAALAPCGSLNRLMEARRWGERRRVTFSCTIAQTWCEKAQTSACRRKQKHSNATLLATTRRGLLRQTNTHHRRFSPFIQW